MLCVDSVTNLTMYRGQVKNQSKNKLLYLNAIVENWLKVVKHNILANEVKLRPADFIKIIWCGCGVYTGKSKCF